MFQKPKCQRMSRCTLLLVLSSFKSFGHFIGISWHLISHMEVNSVSTHRLPQTSKQNQLYPLTSVHSTKADATVTYSWDISDLHDFLSKLWWHILAFMAVTSVQAPCIYNSYPFLRFHMSRQSHCRGQNQKDIIVILLSSLSQEFEEKLVTISDECTLWISMNVNSKCSCCMNSGYSQESFGRLEKCTNK